MNLKDQHVTHKSLGNGVIVSQDNKYITVEFSSKTSMFTYPNPDTFIKFLTLTDPAVHNAVLKETEDARIAAMNVQHPEEAARTVEHHEPEQTTHKSCKIYSSAKSTVKGTERIPGKPMTFYVFQGDTFDTESAGGFIWAPQHSQNGSRVFHWDNILLVKKGDIVLHGCKGYVVAVSSAVSDCYECDRPKERTFENSWNNEGHRVDLKYTAFLNPIKTSDFTYDILEYCKVKYSPFDKAGNGNMGYLYELNRKLACIFLRAAVRSNPYLADLNYVRDLLGEEMV